MQLYEAFEEPRRVLTAPIQDLPPRPGVAFFEGTEIPELALEHDAEWLGALVSHNVMLDNGFTDQLNADVNGIQGLTIARQQVQTENKRSSVASSSAFMMSPADWAGTCRRHFYKLMLGGAQPSRPARTAVDSAALQEVRPMRFIELARVLHHVTGMEGMDEVSERGRDLFRYSNEPTFRSMNILLESGVDLRAVLLSSPSTLLGKSVTDEELVINGKRAEQRYKRALDKLERGKAKISVPETTPAAERVGVGMEHVDRYHELAQVTRLDVVALQAAYPEVDRLSGEAYAQIRRKVSDRADEVLMGGEMRLSDLRFLKTDE